MRLIGFPWLIGGIIGALLIPWLSPIPGLPFVLQALVIFGGNMFLTTIVELILAAFLGPKQ